MHGSCNSPSSHYHPLSSSPLSPVSHGSISSSSSSSSNANGWARASALGLGVEPPRGTATCTDWLKRQRHPHPLGHTLCTLNHSCTCKVWPPCPHARQNMLCPRTDSWHTTHLGGRQHTEGVMSVPTETGAWRPVVCLEKARYVSLQYDWGVNGCL